MNASVTFDRAADYYDQTRGYPPGEEKGVAAILAQAGNLKANSRVLEIGIGTGRIALPLAPHVSSYFGADLSRPMMDKLRAKQNGESIFLTEADVTKLPFPDAAFDAVVAVHVFHLIPNWPDALAEVGRVLRPDAKLIHCWSQDSQNDVFYPLWDAWNAAIGAKADQNFGAPWRTKPDFLGDEGWQPANDVLEHSYPTETSLKQFFDLLRKRVWSSCWRYDDDELARGIAAMEAVIPSVFTDPQAPISRSTIVYARGYLPPS
ncbi:MAG: class I SAM-dependent methyltransferase [Chloroflexota bacterium]